MMMMFSLMSIACSQLTTEQAMITVDLMKPGDEARVVTENNHALIEVTSPTGIGALTATLVEGEWPAEIVTRLRLQGLEGLEIRYGDITLNTGLSSNSNPDPALLLTVTQQDGSTESGYPSADIYYPTIRPGSDEQGTYFDITLPVHFSQEAYPEFSMRWVDFYR